MSSPESYGSFEPQDGQEHSAAYFTNGRNIYEVASYIDNHGLAGGRFTLLRECVSGETRAVDDLHMLFLSEVTPQEPAA